MRDGGGIKAKTCHTVWKRGSLLRTEHVRKIYSYKIQKPINYLQCYWGQILSCSFCVVCCGCIFGKQKEPNHVIDAKVFLVCLSRCCVQGHIYLCAILSPIFIRYSFSLSLASFVQPKWATCGDGTFYNISVPLCWKFVLNNLSCWTSSFSILLLFYTLYFFWLVSAIANNNNKYAWNSWIPLKWMWLLNK